jgi:hypothetical protein
MTMRGNSYLVENIRSNERSPAANCENHKDGVSRKEALEKAEAYFCFRQQCQSMAMKVGGKIERW